MNRFVIWVFLGTFLLAGCAQFLRLQGQAEEKAAQGVEAYCKNTDQAFRDNFKSGVNAKATPHSIEITCG